LYDPLELPLELPLEPDDPELEDFEPLEDGDDPLDPDEPLEDGLDPFDPDADGEFLDPLEDADGEFFVPLVDGELAGELAGLFPLLPLALLPLLVEGELVTSFSLLS